MLQEIIETLTNYTDYPPEEINEDTLLIDDLELGSFDVALMVSEVEDQYGVKIPDEKIVEFRTVGDIEEFLEANQN